MPLNLGIMRGLAAMACGFDEPFILDAGKYEPAFWAPGSRWRLVNDELADQLLGKARLRRACEAGDGVVPARPIAVLAR